MCKVAEYIDNQVEECRERIAGKEAIEWAQLALILRRAKRQHEERCQECCVVPEMAR